MAFPYGYDDLALIWTPNVTTPGTPVALTGYWDMNSPPSTKIKAMIDEYRVAGTAWPNRKDGHGRDYDGKWVIELVFNPGEAVDFDNTFYNAGAQLGTDGVLSIDYGDGAFTQNCTIEDYERVPAPEKQTRCKVTLAQDGAPN